MEIVHNIVSGSTYLAEIRGYNRVTTYMVKQTADNFWVAMDISTYQAEFDANATLMGDAISIYEVLENRAVNDELGILTLYQIDNIMEMRQAITSVQMLGTIDIDQLRETIGSISKLGKEVGALGTHF